MYSIPPISEKPVKFLGRTISDSLSDKHQVDNLLFLSVNKGLALINKSKHRPVQKLWILEYLLLPQLRWPLLIYEIPMTAVVKLEQKISNSIRKWLCLHNSTTNICFYSSSSPYPLPVEGLTSILKLANISDKLLLRESSDPFVASASVPVNASNWVASDAIANAEA